VLAGELETKPGSRISTASLAAAVGVSEAALYRHFASKAQMFEALIEFAEQTIFGVFNQIMNEQAEAETRCHHMATALLRFAERNPGITRVLLGDILVGEQQRLRARVSQFFARVETQFKQVMRESNLHQSAELDATQVAAIARLLLTVVVGRLDQFVRDDFAASPAQDWELQWTLVCRGIFATPTTDAV
jgi:TetR/AcrR family transcriptional regulator